MITRYMLAASAMLCLSGAVAAASEGLPSYRPGISDTITFPDLERATRKEGVFVSAHNIAMVTPGLTKDQVYALIGVPHFHEGLFGVRRWNYILNFYTGEGDNYVACQYQIRFDRNARVERTWFREAACVTVLEQNLTAVTPEAVGK